MSFLERWIEDPVRLRRLKRACVAALAAVALAEIVGLLVAPGHPHFAFESFPAWGSLYGFLSCVAIIVASKLAGKAFLMRREDYYDD